MLPSDRAADRPRAPPDAEPERSAAPKRHRILIVEDEVLIAMDMEDTLGEAGYEVVGATARYSSAIALAGAHGPDLVVMDVRIAGERDGIEAAIFIREAYDIPSLFATAQSVPECRRRAEAARPAGWLIKPFQQAQLVEAVAKALQT